MLDFVLSKGHFIGHTSGLAHGLPPMDGTTSNDELGTTGPSQGDRIDCPYSPSNRPTRKKNSSTTVVDGPILFDERFTEAETDGNHTAMGF